MRRCHPFLVSAVIALFTSFAAAAVDAGTSASPDLPTLKAEAVQRVDGLQKQTQEIVDSLFSFSELGFQEFATQRYLTQLLEKHGFHIERGVAGIPSSWWATWGAGSPVIALGADVDGLPQTSQMPGVAYRQPLIDGGPGHGEGHNAGQAVNIAAALAVKEIMERQRIPGTLVLWPGIAEELVGAKAWYVRAGLFRGVDAVLFTHVGTNLSVAWGQPPGTGLVSVEYTFQGVTAHAAGAPWLGRSALDAVELMNVGWNYRREHLNPQQRSHYVIVDGGDQPNVVPARASVWYYIRELTAQSISDNLRKLDRTAEGATLMTDTSVSRHIVGAAWPRHFNRPIAEAMGSNIALVGLPAWTADDQRFARAVQRLMQVKEQGLATQAEGLLAPPPEPLTGVSDDIGDVSWTVPTVTLHFPANIAGIPTHHWSSSIAMATPIAHQGATAGAKVLAATLLDLLMQPTLRDAAWRYFREEQLASTRYEPFMAPQDTPAVEKNRELMARFAKQLEAIRYDPSRHRTYLEQLGITYPQLEPPSNGRAR